MALSYISLTQSPPRAPLRAASLLLFSLLLSSTLLQVPDWPSPGHLTCLPSLICLFISTEPKINVLVITSTQFAITGTSSIGDACVAERPRSLYAFHRRCLIHSHSCSLHSFSFVLQPCSLGCGLIFPSRKQSFDLHLNCTAPTTNAPVKGSAERIGRLPTFTSGSFRGL